MVAFSNRKASGPVPSQTIDQKLIQDLRQGADVHQLRESLSPAPGVQHSSADLRARLQRINLSTEPGAHNDALATIAEIGFRKVLERILQSPGITKNPDFVMAAERIERARSGGSEGEN